MLEPVSVEAVTLRAQAWGLASGAYGFVLGLLWVALAADYANGVALSGLVGLGATTSVFAAVGFLLGTVEAILRGRRTPLPRWLAVGRGTMNAGNFGSLVGAAASAPAGMLAGSMDLALLIWMGATIAFGLLGAGAAGFEVGPLPAAARLLRWTALSGAVGVGVSAMPALMALATRLSTGDDPSVALTVVLVGSSGFAVSGLLAGIGAVLTDR